MRLELTSCVVRSFRESDALSLARHANNRNIWINLRDGFPHPYTVEDAESFISESLKQAPQTRFAITVEDQAVGGIGFVLHSDVERISAEIGYWLSEQYWGQGIVTEVVGRMTKRMMREFKLHRVYAVPYEWNEASFRVLEKCGYECEGRLRKAAIKDGKVIDQMLWSFVK